MASIQDNIHQAISDFDSIKLAIEECGVNVPYGTDTSDYGDLVKEVKEKGAEQGEISQYDFFWDRFQNYGKRTLYHSAFFDYGKGWTKEILRPKYSLENAETTHAMFQYCYSITDFDEWQKDCGIVCDFRNSTGANNMFFQSASLVSIGRCDFRKLGVSVFIFGNCSKLETVKELWLGEKSVAETWFSNCSALKNVTLKTPIIATNKISFQWSPLLTRESLLGIIDALHDYSGDGLTETPIITLGPSNINKLTAEELSSIESKGWTYK